MKKLLKNENIRVMKYLKIYEEFDVDKLSIYIEDDKNYLYDEDGDYDEDYELDEDKMDGGYDYYKSIYIKLELGGKVISYSNILIGPTIKEFLTKDGSVKIKEFPKKDLSERSVYISRISTFEEDKRNKGYGSKILGKIVDICSENEFEYITLDAIPSSLDFWIKMGFEVYGNYTHDGKVIYHNMIKKI